MEPGFSFSYAAYTQTNPAGEQCSHELGFTISYPDSTSLPSFITDSFIEAERKFNNLSPPLSAAALGPYNI